MPEHHIGISRRFIAQVEAAKGERETIVTVFDKAIALAGADDRDDVSFNQKIADALAYLRGMH